MGRSMELLVNQASADLAVEKGAIEDMKQNMDKVLHQTKHTKKMLTNLLNTKNVWIGKDCVSN